MFSFIFFSVYSNDLLNIRTRHKKHASREVLSLSRKMSFVKKKFICKEKPGMSQKKT